MTRQIVDPARLLRALTLEVSASDTDTYQVTGGSSPHIVQAGTVPWVCDCADSAYRPSMRCKHVVAVYFARQLAAPVRRALRTTLGDTPVGKSRLLQ